MFHSVWARHFVPHGSEDTFIASNAVANVTCYTSQMKLIRTEAGTIGMACTVWARQKRLSFPEQWIRIKWGIGHIAEVPYVGDCICEGASWKAVASCLFVTLG